VGEYITSVASRVARPQLAFVGMRKAGLQGIERLLGDRCGFSVRNLLNSATFYETESSSTRYLAYDAGGNGSYVQTGRVFMGAHGGTSYCWGVVYFHIKNLVDKLGANDRAHALTIAFRRGLLQI
jgi:hypothetical protein